jgi:hypothetical protein
MRLCPTPNPPRTPPFLFSCVDHAPTPPDPSLSFPNSSQAHPSGTLPTTCLLFRRARARPAPSAGAAHRVPPWFSATDWIRLVLGGEGCRQTGSWSNGSDLDAYDLRVVVLRSSSHGYQGRSSLHGHLGSCSRQGAMTIGAASHSSDRRQGRVFSPNLPLLF